MPGIHLKMIYMCIAKRIHMCSEYTCHMQMACDILPPTEVQMAKHRRDMPSVCDLLNECGYSNRSGNALAYDFNLLSLQIMFLYSYWRHWFYNQFKRKFSQSKYSAEVSTVGIEVSSPTNWLPQPGSSRGRKGAPHHVRWLDYIRQGT